MRSPRTELAAGPCPSRGTGLGRLWSQGERPDDARLEASGVRPRPKPSSGLLGLTPLSPDAAAWRKRHRRRRERAVPPGRTTRALRRPRDRRGLLSVTAFVLALALGVTGLSTELGRPTPRPMGARTLRVVAVRGRVEGVRPDGEQLVNRRDVFGGGSTFRCDDGAELELVTALPGVHLLLDGGAVATLHDLRHDEASGQSLLRLELLRGRARLRVEAAGGKVIARIQSPHGSEVWTRRSRLAMQVREDATDWTVLDGAAAVVAGDERVVLAADHGLRSTFDAPLGAPRQVNATRLAWGRR